mgnify:CR=1 FL=1
MTFCKSVNIIGARLVYIVDRHCKPSIIKAGILNARRRRQKKRFDVLLRNPIPACDASEAAHQQGGNMIKGKNNNQLKETFFNMCKEKGVNPQELANQYNIKLPK